MTTAIWSPSSHDHLLYQWVKLEGRSQRDAASMLGISQATVSRMLQRYERWQAHAADREGGRLDHSERFRAQRWQTFECNQLILASCLRIASEMEGFTDVSKSTVQRSSHGGDEKNICTQHSTIDRSGIASRFLRLAFRINMEQFRLASLDPAPLPNPLTPEEIADQERASAAIAADVGWAPPTDPADDVSRAPRTEPADHEAWHPTATPLDSPTTSITSNKSQATSITHSPPPSPSDAPTSSIAPTHHAPTPIHPVNQMHQPETNQIDITPEPTPPCATSTTKPKKSDGCIKPRTSPQSCPSPGTAPISPASSSGFQSPTLTLFATALGTG